MHRGMKGNHLDIRMKISAFSGTSVKMDLVTATVENLETTLIRADHLFVNLSLVSTTAHFQSNICINANASLCFCLWFVNLKKISFLTCKFRKHIFI